MMKIITLLFILILCQFSINAQDELFYPIDIVYHSETENYYVSNWADGEGYILKLDKEGSIVETFLTGLHYAGGMCIADNILYVLDNYDLNISGSSQPSFLMGIEIESGNSVLIKKISSGGTYLDFIAQAHGNLYISDDQQSKIYKYNIQNNSISDFLTNLNSPFGICYDDYNDRLIFTENGSGISFLKSVHPLGGEVTSVYYTEAYMKGVVRHPNANFYYTTWDVNSTEWGDEVVGMVVNNFSWDYTFSELHNRPFGLCIGYDNHLVVCNWGDHTLTFYDLDALGEGEIEASPDQYSVYPNPSNGRFKIVFPDNLLSVFEISVINLTGQQVYTEKFDNANLFTEKEFELDHLPAGTYILKIKDHQSISQKKLIIK